MVNSCFYSLGLMSGYLKCLTQVLHAYMTYLQEEPWRPRSEQSSLVNDTLHVLPYIIFQKIKYILAVSLGKVI